jgi:hypothetical protein
MSYEYYLVPKNEYQTFPQQTVDAMQNYLNNFPIYIWEDGTYILFHSVADRDRRVPQLLAKPQRNNYLDPAIHIEPHEVMLSTVADPEVDQYLYNFVLWCQERWSCDLYYGGKTVSPEELIAEP